MPEVIALVAEFRNIRKYQKAVGESLGDQELLFVFFCQFHTIPLAVGVRILSQVNSNVKNTALDDSDKLCLRKLFLEVQSSQYALGGAGLIVLYKVNMDPSLFHVSLGVSLHEVSTIIAVNGRGDDAKPFNAAYILFYCNLSH